MGKREARTDPYAQVGEGGGLEPERRCILELDARLDALSGNAPYCPAACMTAPGERTGVQSMRQTKQRLEVRNELNTF